MIDKIYMVYMNNPKKDNGVIQLATKLNEIIDKVNFIVEGTKPFAPSSQENKADEIFWATFKKPTLLPCPFCGCTAEFHYMEDCNEWDVYCTFCDACIANQHDKFTASIVWNNRK